MQENPDLDLVEAADPRRLEKQEIPLWKEVGVIKL